MAVNPRLALTHAAPPAPAPQTVTATPAPQGDGRDMAGTINTMAAAFVAHAAPVVTQQILPVLQRDAALHKAVGSAVGTSVARELKPYVVVATVAVAGAAGVYAWRALTRPRRRR
jgi:hypothetical protein